MVVEDIFKYLNLIVDGCGYVGKIEEYSFFDLMVFIEEFCGGGMDQLIDIDMGQEKMICFFVLIFYDVDVFVFWGVKDGFIVQFIVCGFFESLDGIIIVVVYYMQGKMILVVCGIWGFGNKLSLIVIMSLCYYCEVYGQCMINEIDVINMVCVIDGVD